ncbi:MAG: phosphatidylglycerophosphatase A [Chitinophagaceae bacterium]|nr:phosphatidylglycerophosphatase A [Chitinophagaceae bacterium]
MSFSKTIAAVFGIGYLPKGGGTVAAAVYCLIWFLTPEDLPLFEIACLIVVLVLGIWSASRVETDWGTDSNRVVIDEFAGMMISLLFVPKRISYLIFAFLFFRLFDILKPLGIRKTEKFPGGWGVMADDVLSGIYTWILLNIVLEMKLF